MTLPPLNAAEFEAVFIAVHGCRPFPWQARLARLLADTGRNYLSTYFDAAWRARHGVA